MSGRFGRLGRKRSWIVIDDRNAYVTVGRTSEGRAARDHLIKHDPQTEYVATRVNRLPLSLLWRHIASGSEYGPRIRVTNRHCHRFRISCGGFSLGEFSQPEIQNLDEPIPDKTIFPQHDVLRLYISVDNTRGMCRFQSHGDLNRNPKRFIYFHRITPQTLSEGLAFDELCSNIESRVRLSDLENGKDVGMIERKDCPGFLFEAAHSTFVFGEFWWENLERYFAAMLLCVFPKKDFAHSTLAQPFENAIMGNRRGDV